MTTISPRGNERQLPLATTTGTSHPNRRSGGVYQRLPKDVIPIKYIICVKPRWEDAFFEGSEIIHITIKKETSEIIMNAVDMTIGKIVWEEDVTENRQEPLEYALDAENECLKITFEPPLYPSDGTLRINFNGKIYTKGYRGMYRSNRLPNDLAETPHPEYYLLTNFKPSHARRCFPCWDEPSFKAVFEMCFVVPTFYTALSNMPLKASFAHRSNVQLHMVECMQTPSMSSHAVGFCLGKFEYLWGKTNDKIPFRVHTELEKKKYGNYAAKLLKEFLSFFKDYIKCPFPLDKLDLVVLPDVCSVAVRNWGLITCRDTSVFADDDSTPMFLQDVSLLLAREVAHQWFGNLVTMDWFNYLWLHQGLANFTSQLAVDKFAPQYDILTQFVCNVCIPALDADCNLHSPALENPVNNLAEFTDLNYYLTCKKGACLIRMLHNYVGDNDFRRGLLAYLDQYQHQNVTSMDFFAVIEQVSGKPVVAIFKSWVTLPGYPLIRVSSKQEGSYRTFTLTQEKFCEHSANGKEKDVRSSSGKDDSTEKDPIWMIPITFAAENRENILSVVLDRKTTKVSILLSKVHWVSVNPGHYGFFRVRYSTDCFAQLISAIRKKNLPVFERMSLLSDLYSMILNGLSSTIELLNVLEAYVDETHYAVWKIIIFILRRLNFLLDSSDYYKKFQIFVNLILSRIADKTTFEVKDKEEHLNILRQTLILSTLVRFRNQRVLKEARKIFEAFQKGETIIPHSVRVPVYEAVLQNDDEETIRTFFKMYHESKSLEEKDRIAKSLGAVSDIDNVKLVLDFAITSDVRGQHTVTMLQSLGRQSSREGREVTWKFFKDNWAFFRQIFSGSDLIASLVNSVTENFASEEKAVDITNFFHDHHIAGTDRMILLNCAKIRDQESIFKRDTNSIQDYLSSYA